MKSSVQCFIFYNECQPMARPTGLPTCTCSRQFSELYSELHKYLKHLTRSASSPQRICILNFNIHGKVLRESPASYWLVGDGSSSRIFSLFFSVLPGITPTPSVQSDMGGGSDLDWHNLSGRDTHAQAVIRRLPTTAARVRAQVRSWGICRRKSGTGTGFLRVQ
jgi:hypothetical protein